MESNDFNADDFINTSFENVSELIAKPVQSSHDTVSPNQLTSVQPLLRKQSSENKLAPKPSTLHVREGEAPRKKKQRRFERNLGSGRMRTDLRLALKQKAVSNMFGHQHQQSQFMPYMVPQMIQNNQTQFLPQMVPVTTSPSPQFQLQPNMISPPIGYYTYQQASSPVPMNQYQFVSSQPTLSPTAKQQEQSLLSPTTNDILNQLQFTSIQPASHRPSMIDTALTTPRLSSLSNNTFRSPSLIANSFPLSPSILNFSQLPALKSDPNSVQSSASDIAGQLKSFTKESSSNKQTSSSYSVASNPKTKLQVSTKPLPPKKQNPDEVMFSDNVLTPNGDAQSFADFLRRKSSVMPDSPFKAPASKKMW